MTSYLGIDPGVHSAWAVVSSSYDLLDYGEIIYSRKCHETATEVVLRLSTVYNLKMACVEQQYVGVNAHSAIALAQNAGRWLEALSFARVPASLVAASTWQSDELGVRSRASRDVRKHASMARCRGLWGLSASEHVCDAALLARWVAVEHARSK